MHTNLGEERYPYPMSLRAIRGAIQLPANTSAEIAAGVQELISAILDANHLTPSDVISVFFTSTVDLNAAFPAAACREMGFSNVPLIGSVEVDVPGALDKTVRAMLHVETKATPEEITHIYLHGAAALRRDIAQ
jgi:chorismate mutase